MAQLHRSSVSKGFSVLGSYLKFGRAKGTLQARPEEQRLFVQLPQQPRPSESSRAACQGARGAAEGAGAPRGGLAGFSASSKPVAAFAGAVMGLLSCGISSSTWFVISVLLR